MRRALDLFCGAGGATKGLQRAGYHVTGVDIKPQLRYCGDAFIQADAMTFPLEGYDLIWASPPCQAFTQMSARWRGRGGKADSHLDLLSPTLARLSQQETPWIVENVIGARRILAPAIKLHGGMFGLGVHRPRLFRTSWLVLEPPPSSPCADPIGVYGQRGDGRCLFVRTNGNGGKQSVQRAARSTEEACEAMGIDWMTEWREVCEAIPPAYAEFIARQAP